MGAMLEQNILTVRFQSHKHAKDMENRIYGEWLNYVDRFFFSETRSEEGLDSYTAEVVLFVTLPFIK